MPSCIVVAEDDSPSLYATRRTLELPGYKVVAYSSASLAWNAIREGLALDLLLTDIRFPIGQPHGIALARHLRLRQGHIPVIFMTGYLEVVEEVPEDLGPVLMKPIERDALLEAVRTAIEKQAEPSVLRRLLRSSLEDSGGNPRQ
jgi:DNA-binding NtrC family response regulator